VRLRRAFFFEKKKQKTFAILSRPSPAAYAKVTKVFWFFFSKKNILPFRLALPPRFRHTPARHRRPPGARR
jgi:hypothetical protein